MSDSPAVTVAYFAEGMLLLAGLGLLWRHALRPAARATPAALLPWSIPPSDFLLFVLVIIAGGFVGSVGANLGLARTGLPADTRLILASAAFQLGLLTPFLFLPVGFGHPALRPPLGLATLVSGVIAFLITLPIVTAINFAWLGLLNLVGLPAEKQDLIRLFTQTGTPALVALLIVLATFVAPFAEELLFRGTIFRYLRTRLSRWVALLLPGTFFAALHVNWTNLDGLASFAPLAGLAVVFSLAYERTGRLGTVIVAHSLFNLHTIILLLAGVTN